MEKGRKKYEILKEIYRENENITRFSERGKFAQKEIDLKKKEIGELQRIIDESFSETQNSSEKISCLFDELSNITVIPVKEPELVFENKVVYWNNKKNKIYAIGKTKTLLMLLWRSKKHRATLEKLEHFVWRHKEKGKKKTEEVKTEREVMRVNVGSKFMDSKKITSFINYINHKLEKSSFPYKIISACDNRDEIIGYKLKIRTQPTKKTKKNRQDVLDLIEQIHPNPKK
jgi:hypothetical protein